MTFVVELDERYMVCKSSAPTSGNSCSVKMHGDSA